MRPFLVISFQVVGIVRTTSSRLSFLEVKGRFLVHVDMMKHWLFFFLNTMKQWIRKVENIK